MSYEFYKILHLGGLLLLFLALGFLIARMFFTDKENPQAKKLPMILHGVALVIMLISGFGMSAKLGIGMSGWLIAKLVIWLLLGGSVALIRRTQLSTGIKLSICWLLGFAAVWLAVLKPF